MTYIGLDVHKNHSTAAYRDPVTSEICVKKMKTDRDAFARFVCMLPQPWIVAVEATREAPWVCRALIEHGAEVHLANPRQLAPFGKHRRAKTDAKDAELLLDAIEKGYLPEAYLAPQEVQELRAIARTQTTLRGIATKLSNATSSLLCQNGIKLPGTKTYSKKNREAMAQTIEQLSDPYAQSVGLLWELREATERQTRLLTSDIEKAAKEDELLKALCQLPGVGALTAFALVAEIGDIRRFETVARLHSYAGVVPKVSDTGDSHYAGRLPKECNKRLRRVAISAAQSASRTKKPNEFKETYARLRAKQKPANTAKIAVARKVLTRVFHIWKDLIDG